MYNLNRIIVIVLYYIYTYAQVYTLGKKWVFAFFLKKNLAFCPISQNNCPKIEFQNVIIGSLKRHYRYGAIKLKKKKKAWSSGS